MIPSQRIDTMELLYPKRKPVGNVKIDWSHPLAKNLTCCILMGGVDLVDESLYSISVNSFKKEAGTGNSLENGKIDTATRSRYTTPTNESFSNYILAKYPPTQVFQKIAGSTSSHWFGRYSGHYLAQFPSGVLVCPPGLFTPNVWHSLHASRDVSVTHAGINGVYYSSGTDTSNLYSLGSFGIGHTQEVGIFPGQIAVYYQWSRALSSVEIQSIHNNPYQFLVPV